jgi:hypothetical protein
MKGGDIVDNQIPIACVPSAMNEEQKEKYCQIREELANCLQETSELSNGFAFRYPDKDSVILKIAEFISLERLCCPFFNFELRVEPDSVWLNLTGPEGAKEIIKENFIKE